MRSFFSTRAPFSLPEKKPAPGRNSLMVSQCIKCSTLVYNFFDSFFTQENNQQCHEGCNTPTNCCMISNTCYNGGTCLPRDNYGQKARRFDCKCPVGYKKSRCQQPIRSCRGYSDGNRVAGKYTVIGVDKMSYEVFCDFDDSSTMTWTLVQSNQRDHKVEALSYDKPFNQDNISWNGYRLSNPRMKSIQEDSTMWRATCQYQEQSCSDLVRGFNDKMDILTNMDGCFEVEYIYVRGHSCSNCTVYFQQSDSCTFHFSTLGLKQCKFNQQMKLQHYRPFTDYFGGCYYLKDTTHCCSQSPTATTQIWFGGH